METARLSLSLLWYFLWQNSVTTWPNVGTDKKAKCNALIFIVNNLFGVECYEEEKLEDLTLFVLSFRPRLTRTSSEPVKEYQKNINDNEVIYNMI